MDCAGTLSFDEAVHGADVAAASVAGGWAESLACCGEIAAEGAGCGGGDQHSVFAVGCACVYAIAGGVSVFAVVSDGCAELSGVDPDALAECCVAGVGGTVAAGGDDS